jgi:hypothetical protein
MDGESNPTDVAPSYEASNTEKEAENKLLEELIKRLTPLLLNKINDLITDAMNCKCCS